VPTDSVRPGLHRLTPHDSPEEPYDVVWWDPACLNLQAESHFGVNHEEILADDDSGIAAESVRLHQEWREARSRVCSAGVRARFDLIRAAQTSMLSPPRAAVRSATVDRPQGGPSGRRFGTLVHLLLRDVPVDAQPAAVASLASMHARTLGASDEETRAAGDRVIRALRHPLLTQAAAAALCHREWPLITRLDDGSLLEGVVDLAYFTGGEWTVVDFKTDADLAGTRYESQLSWYVWAVERLTGRRATGWLLNV
jgi:ATP-dependent exoDNAse (exonuclease V) beta subunit